MNVYWPVFGYPDDPHVCQKWFVLADNDTEALTRATSFYDSVASELLPYYSPAREWVGPLFAVQPASIKDNICFLGG